MPEAVPLGAAVLAAMALLLIFGAVLLVKFIGAIFHDVPLIGGWLARHITQPVLVWLNDIQHDLLDVLESLLREFERLENALGAWLAGVIGYLFHLNDKTNYLYNQQLDFRDDLKRATGSQTVNHSIAALRSEVEKATQKGNEGVAGVATIRNDLNGPYHRAIDQRILAAQHNAEVHSRSAFTSVIDSQNDILHRRIQQLEVSLGITIPDAEATIPYALAGVMAYTAVLTAEAESCYNPMCGDWRAAKAALEGALGTLSAAGAISFLVAAIENPSSTAALVAGSADAVGNAAVDNFYELLGIQNPAATEPGS